jgi:hypothetical protein
MLGDPALFTLPRRITPPLTNISQNLHINIYKVTSSLLFNDSMMPLYHLG